MGHKSNWELCVGDRVSFYPYGEGTIHVIHEAGGTKSYGVCFDHDFGGHILDGTCPDGHGWWCGKEELKPIGRVPEYELAPVSAMFE